MWQEIKNIYHLVVAVAAQVGFGFPSRKLKVIGVTGTDGKTTTVNLIYHILHTCGYPVSMISTVGAIINGEKKDLGFHVTNPSSWQLNSFIKKAAEKSKYLVLEITSHGIDQNRIFGIPFTIGVITNVTNEHLDYHKTYGRYLQTKARFLKRAQIIIANQDDNSYKAIMLLLKDRNRMDRKVITYGKMKSSMVNPFAYAFKTKLIGNFNRSNELAAIATALALGVKESCIKAAFETFEAPIGRQQVVYEGDFTVMIDFAHTPNAIEELLSSIKPSIKGRLIHVFGSAGERDRKKRPDMGRASARYSDIIILTAEDPRSESAGKIVTEIELGIANNSKFKIQSAKLLKIPSRQEAINTAIKMAQKGDFVLITGKGHETSMNYGRGEEPWSEFEVVKEAIRKLKTHE